MADFIFSKVQVQKSTLYDQIKTLLLNAGWTNVSSNSSTDYDVFQSIGSDGTKNLVFQMRQTDTNNANAIQTTSGANLSIRLVGGYIPGANGAAGTFTKSTAMWYNLPLFPYSSGVPLDLVCTLWYHITKNHIACVIESTTSLALQPCIFFIGLPDEYYCSEPNSRGLLYAPGFTWGNSGFNSGVLMTDSPGEMSFLTANEFNTVYSSLPPISPNSAGKFIPNECLYGSSSEGLRGRIPCFYFLLTTNVLNGDILLNGARSYKVFNYQSNGGSAYGTVTYSPWPSAMVAIQTA